MKKTLSLSILLLMALNTQAADLKSNTNQTVVKKSSSGICHGVESRFYSKLKHFTSYDNLKACLDSGGQMPGNKQKK